MHARSSPRHPKEETCEFGVKDDTGDHSERVIDLTPTRLDAYAQQRLAAGRSRSCVNYELAAVRRAFRLAIEKGLLATMPVIKLPKVQDARSGFFEDSPFAALVLELPPDVAALVKFLGSPAGAATKPST